MKKFLALGVLATFFLAPSVQAQDWHRARGRSQHYQNHRQHRPVRGHFNYQRARHHRPATWGHRNYHQARHHRQVKWGNRNYSGNRSYHRARHYRPAKWGHNNYHRWTNNNYHRRWNNRTWSGRQPGWGYSQANGRGSYQLRSRQYSNSRYR